MCNSQELETDQLLRDICNIVIGNTNVLSWLGNFFSFICLHFFLPGSILIPPTCLPSEKLFPKVLAVPSIGRVITGPFLPSLQPNIYKRNIINIETAKNNTQNQVIYILVENVGIGVSLIPQTEICLLSRGTHSHL